MKKLYLSVCFLIASSAAWANPPMDELDLFLKKQELVHQVQSTSQRVRNKASELVMSAMGFVGVPYRYGGNSVDTGFDCSGFVRAAFEQTVGKVLPRRAAEQAAVTRQIDRSQLKPGDLVFFNTMRRAFSHVGIYVGEGKFIHSPRAGASIRIDSMDASYWNGRFDGARRVFDDNSSPAVSQQPPPAASPVVQTVAAGYVPDMDVLQLRPPAAQQR